MSDWTPWNGESVFPQGLSLTAGVITRYRSGRERKRPAVAQFLDWSTTGKRGKDIVAYREVNP
jgi:hypothetical protein